MRRFTALLGLLLSLLALPAMAQVRITFYSHASNAGGDGMYPHAFIRATGQPHWAPAAIDDTFGFTAGETPLVLIRAPGKVRPSPADYVGRSTPHFWVEISDDQYRALLDRIDTWNRPPGSYYNLYRRNCITLVAELASQLGLVVGNARTLNPEVFLNEMTQLNAGRINLGPPPPLAQVALPAPPAVAQPALAQPALAQPAVTQ